ncbi:MAG: hypothetical protein ACKV2Q_35970 [Planctomycetaceae bacterium]
MKFPRDKTPYPQDPRSQLLRPGTSDGLYVYVQDAAGTIHVLRDGPHLHPKVLGFGAPAMYAGDLVMLDGKITELTNLSGTFQFDDPDGLLNVAACLGELGIEVVSGAIRFFPVDGSRPRVIG